MPTYQEILDCVATWPADQRAQLIDALLATELSDEPRSTEETLEIESAWRQTAVVRLQELQSGQAATVSWEDVQTKTEQMIYGHKLG
ncbi:MAG: addiction module protein [Pirellulales bacterium]|nr:addiction module protein [Pirellulales bacterium]